MSNGHKRGVVASGFAAIDSSAVYNQRLSGNSVCAFLAVQGIGVQAGALALSGNFPFFEQGTLT
ncbi:MAG TPA: hypothetical protein PLY54_06840 [Ottowia sp.]|nr:hypothetical protein [Ottowia sp.]